MNQNQYKAHVKSLMLACNVTQGDETTVYLESLIRQDVPSLGQYIDVPSVGIRMPQMAFVGEFRVILGVDFTRAWDDVEYAVLLHELGHANEPRYTRYARSTWNDALPSECFAWVWAMDNAAYWSVKMDLCLNVALGTYVDDAERHGRYDAILQMRDAMLALLAKSRRLSGVGI